MVYEGECSITVTLKGSGLSLTLEGGGLPLMMFGRGGRGYLTGYSGASSTLHFDK